MIYMFTLDKGQGNGTEQITIVGKALHWWETTKEYAISDNPPEDIAAGQNGSIKNVKVIIPQNRVVYMVIRPGE